MMHSIFRSGLVFLFFILSTTLLKAQSKSDSATAAPLDNTVWRGVDSDNDFYQFTFLQGGQLSYRTTTSRQDTATFTDVGDVWCQNGNIIIFTITDYTTYRATIKNDTMEGVAWNVDGKRWTWKVMKVKN